MRFGWHEQSAGVIAVDGILVQAACFITGDRQVVALRYKLIRQLNGGDALRAIARTGERDQQQRVRRAEIIHRVGDQIGRRYRGDVFPRVAGKPWRNDVADKSRRTRAGQNDPQIGLAQQWRQKTVDRRAQIINIVERAKPAGWLLADLFFGPGAGGGDSGLWHNSVLSRVNSTSDAGKCVAIFRFVSLVHFSN